MNTTDFREARVFQVNYHTEDSFIDGEFIADRWKTKDFSTFPAALCFAQSHSDICGASGIEELEIHKTKSGAKEVLIQKWEVTQTEHYIVN